MVVANTTNKREWKQLSHERLDDVNAFRVTLEFDLAGHDIEHFEVTGVPLTCAKIISDTASSLVSIAASRHMREYSEAPITIIEVHARRGRYATQRLISAVCSSLQLVNYSYTCVSETQMWTRPICDDFGPLKLDKQSLTAMLSMMTSVFCDVSEQGAAAVDRLVSTNNLLDHHQKQQLLKTLRTITCARARDDMTARYARRAQATLEMTC